MANKTNIKKGILDFDYIKALNIIDPNYLNKIFITLRGGNSNHVNTEADWYRINNTDLLVNLYLDHNKKKLYALSISKIPKNKTLINDDIVVGGLSDITNAPNATIKKESKGRSKGKSPGRPRKSSKSPGRPKSSERHKSPGRPKSPRHKSPGRPKKMYDKVPISDQETKDMFKVDYEDVDEYGGKKKKRGRKPKKTIYNEE